MILDDVLEVLLDVLIWSWWPDGEGRRRRRNRRAMHRQRAMRRR